MKPGFMLAGIAAMALIAAAGIALILGDPRRLDDPHRPTRPALTEARIGGPFTLVNSRGEAVTDQTFRGRWTLVFFGFTFCPDVCPTAMSEVAATLHDLGPLADRVQPLFVSIDPARDTPEHLGQFTAAFDRRIEGLTGSPEQVAAAAKAYGAYYRKVGDGADYTMDHSAIIYVMNPEGRFVTSFNHLSGAERMVQALRPLLSLS